MPKFLKNLFSEKGLIPLFFLAMIGVAALVGGVYIIREQYVRTNKAGRAELDTDKIRKELYTERTPLPSIGTPRSTLKQEGVFKYTPSKPAANPEDTEPSFSINPPSGWERSSQQDEVTKVVFLAPEEDEVVAGDELKATNKAKLQVNIVKGKGATTLESLVDYYISSSKPDWETLTVNSKTKTTLSGQPAYRLEIEAFKKGVTFSTLSYVLVKGKYGIVTYGGALKSAWAQRQPQINSSLNSFKFTE